MLFVLLLMFISFNSRIAKQTESTNEIAKSTNQVVKGQGDILKAIKQVTEDTRITADQQTAIIICMLQVPIDQRTTDLQSKCRTQYQNVAPRSVSETPPSSTGNTPVSSYPQSTPQSQPTQQEKPQPAAPSKPLVPRTIDNITNLIKGIL